MGGFLENNMSNGPSKLDEIRFHMDMPEFHGL